MHRVSMFAKPHDSGRATLEFLVVGIAGVIPTLWFAMSVISLQGASLAAETAARHALRVVLNAKSTEEMAAGAHSAVLTVIGQHGFLDYADLSLACEPSNCLNPGARILITVTLDAPVFSSNWLPGVLGNETLPVRGSAAGMVSRYGVPR